MKEINHFDLFKDALDEKNVTVQNLEDKHVLAPHTFYNFKENCPSLHNAISMANSLEMSLDYILLKTDVNQFKKYKLIQNNFHTLLSKLLSAIKISKSQLCKDLQISRTNFSFWKKGSIPKFSTIIAIADYLGCSIDDLLEHE